MNDDSETSEIENEAQGSNQLERAGDDDLGGRLASLRARVFGLASQGGPGRPSKPKTQETTHLRALEAISLFAAAMVTILTYLMPGHGQISEANPLMSAVIDAGGWYAFAGVRLGAVALAFAVVYRVAAAGREDARLRSIAFGGALAAAGMMVANAVTDAYATYTLGLPETMVVAEVVTFGLVVLAGSAAWFWRLEVVAGLEVARRTGRSIPARQIATVAVVLLLVVSGVPFGGLVPGSDSKGTASAASSMSVNWTQSYSWTGNAGVGYDPSRNSVYGIGDSAIEKMDAADGTGTGTQSTSTTRTMEYSEYTDKMYIEDTTNNQILVHNGGDLSEYTTISVNSPDGNSIEAADNQDMFIYGDQDTVEALDSDGNGIWSYTIRDSGTSTSIRDLSFNEQTNQTLHTGTYSNGPIVSLINDSGTKVWDSTSFSNSGIPAGALGTERVFVADGSTLRALDVSDGTEVDNKSFGTSITSLELSDDGKRLYIGLGNGDVHSVSPGTLGDEKSVSTSLGDASDLDVGVINGDYKVFVHDGTDNQFARIDTSTSQGEPLNGTVTNDEGTALENATVDIVNSSTGSTAASVTTDASGYYEATVDAGTYDITADHPDQLASTKTVDVPSGGTTVDFSLDPGPGSVTFLGEDGTEITDRPVEMRLYEANDDNINRDAAWWLDEYDGEPIRTVETSSASNISLADTALEGGQYVAVFRSNDTGVSPIYKDASMVIVDDNTRLDWDLHLVGGDKIRVTAAIRDHTGNWPPADTRIRAESYNLGERYDEAALGAENRARLDIPPNEEVAYFLVREDGTERYLGATTVDVSEADEPVVFDVLEPGEEYEKYENQTGSTEPWDNETDIHYPPLAQIDASPLDPVAGDTVTYNASDSKAFDDVTIAEYNWELPDGSTASGESVTWTPTSSEAGEAHTATVEIVDEEGATDQTSITLYVAEDAESAAPPPIADANVTTDAPTVGEPVVLESSATAEAGIDKIEWDLNDDGQFTDTGSSAEVVPEESGIQTVGIRVIDENGATDTFYTSFFVAAENTEGLDGTGGSGAGSFGPIGGAGGSSGGTGSKVVLGGMALAGYALWRRAGGTSIVTVGRKAVPVVASAATTATSVASTVVRGLASAVGRLVGR